jgi:PPOX class probable F420-dependent enzyme
MLRLPRRVCELLDRVVVAQISTVSPAGRPQSSLVWFERRGDELVFFSEVTTPKVRNLRANPNIDVLVVHPDREAGAGTPLYIRLSGRADLRSREEGLEDRLARRYGHPDGYPAEFGPLGETLAVHVTVDRVSGLGPRGSGPAAWSD